MSPVVRQCLAPLMTACAVAMLTACTSTTPQPTPAQSPTVYSDPFAYCAAVGTVDAPNEQYSGPAMPEIIVQGMIQQGIVSADAPLEFQQNAVWRCMDGQVWVCHFGANLPCLERADTSREPTPAMESFWAHIGLKVKWGTIKALRKSAVTRFKLCAQANIAT